ncbi:orotidine-5'-phosphate decarboxylase [Candidatus Rariloculus sp.]|uniref:orotidine-5'-phosphate decarboxylase n=1 Tax=Candidatus Rariloculus sp. TaxID=3101265 RepID=UPI003D0FB133
MANISRRTAIERQIPASERLIIALDVDTPDEAWDFVESLGESVSFYKVGLQLFLGPGMTIVEQLIGAGKKVFLDLKIDDTPRTVKEAVRRAAIDGVELFTLQGNRDTAIAARDGRGRQRTPRFLQVTFLSSWDTSDLKAHFGIPESADITLDQAVLNRTETILGAGCEGVIASGQSVGEVRQRFGPDVLIVTPGIRPGDASKDDHKRSLTPRDAIFAGSDYLVVGRPVRNAADPKHAAQAIIAEIETALVEKPTPAVA